MCEDGTGAAMEVAGLGTSRTEVPGVSAYGMGDRELWRLVERYQVAERVGCYGVWDWEPATGRAALSPCFLELVGIPATHGGSRVEEWFSRVHPDDLIWLRACFEGQEEKSPEPFYMEHRVLRQRVSTGGDGWR